MAKISISLPDELLNYIDQKVDNRSALIESLLKQWQKQRQDEALKPNNPLISPAVVEVPASAQNGLSVDSLLICVEPMTFDKIRLTQQLGELEAELLEQSQNILRRYLSLNNN